MLAFTGAAPMVAEGTYRGVDVQFTKLIENLEGYLDAGMRARILDVKLDAAGDCVQILFDVDIWTDHNMPLEAHNYYDKQGNAVLTCREAGLYRKQEWYYFELKDNPVDYFNLLLVKPEQKYTVIYHESEDAQFTRMIRIETANLSETLNVEYPHTLYVFRGWPDSLPFGN
jgi:hypothetical protein